VLSLGGLFPLNGCGLVRNVDAAPVEGLQTVVRVVWTTSAILNGHVEFGPLGDCARYKTPMVGLGDTHEALLLGLPPATEACYKIIATDGDFEWPEATRTVQTGNIPAAVPNFQVPVHDRGLVDEGFLLAASGTTPGLVLILDRDGHVVWYQPADEGYVSPQAQPDPTTGGVIHNRFSKDFSLDVGTVRRIDVDGALLDEIRTPLAHHSFEVLDDGTIAWLAIDVREHSDWGDVVGDALREVTADGADRAVWSTWNDWEIRDLDESDREFYPQGADWTHGNFLSWSDVRQSYTLSFRNVNTIVELDRDGDLLRGVGEYGDHTVDDLDGLVQYPHSAYWTDEGTLLFTTTPGGGEETWAVELAFDADTGTAERIWSWGEGEGFYAQVLGEALRLPNGNTLVNFGSEGVVVEVTENGETGWRLETPTGYFPGHLTFIRDLYDPAAQD
jgi:hypothetical protein